MAKKVAAVFGILALCFGIYWGTRAYYRQEIEQIKTEKAPQAPSVEYSQEKGFLHKVILISGETIEAGVRDIGKLCTAEYYFTHVEEFFSEKDLWGLAIPGTKSSYVYSYDGTILAGVDFTKTVVSVEENTKTVLIRLPNAELISSEIDPDSFVLYGEKKSIFNPFEIEDFSLTYKDMIEAEEKKAVDSGVLVRAEENAQVLLRNFLLEAFSFEGYSVKVVVGNGS